MIKSIICFYIIFRTLSLFAGECIKPKKFYISIISNCYYSGKDYIYIYMSDGITSGQVNLSSAISSLSHRIVDYGMGYEYFATTNAIKKIEKETSLYKKKVFKYLSRYTESTNKYIRRRAIMTLSYYGWPKSYKYLHDLDIRPVYKAVLFGILREKRAINFIIEEYKKIDRKYKKRPMFSYPQKMNYLNALYHIASINSLKFINKIIKNPRPEKIKKRAITVKQRILDVNLKEMKNLLEKNWANPNRKVIKILP